MAKISLSVKKLGLIYFHTAYMSPYIIVQKNDLYTCLYEPISFLILFVNRFLVEVDGSELVYLKNRISVVEDGGYQHTTA